MKTKICKSCGLEKPLIDFYKHKEMSDGYLNICKECKKRYANEYRNINLEKVHQYDRNRPNAKERTEKNKLTLAQDPIRRKKYQDLKNNWGRQNYIKRKAHNYVKRAIEKGLLIKPLHCELCGATERIEAHHENYNKPLDVIFVCSTCHHKIHKFKRILERKAG
jgi:hypothetical protein